MTHALIPVGLRVHLAHATIQALADDCGADLVHIKGPALDASLRATDADSHALPRLSTDADVLVRPAHVTELLRSLARHGWDLVTRFESGSAFGHAATLWHTQLGYVDVHRHFPGIEADPREAFEVLWAEAHHIQLAHWPCRVPSVDAQRLLLVLHGARGGGLRNADVARVWTAASPQERARAEELARTLQAEVALAAATGRLADFTEYRTHDLWQHFAEGGSSRLAEWRARYKAARTWPERLSVLARASIVNTDHLAMELGRTPTRAEVAAEYAERLGVLRRELRRALRRRGPR